MTIANKKTLPLKAVYCYYFPEVRRIIDQVSANYPHDIFLQSISPGLDDFHLPVIDTYMKHFQDQLPDLPSFPYHYVTGGASESIFHLLSYILSHEKSQPLYVLEGEYEGYAGYGQNLNLVFTTAKDTDHLLTLPPGIVFLSNPSARNGNIIPNTDILSLCQVGHRIVYDATYVGLTQPHLFSLTHPNIIAVITSLSKPFGLYYYRLGFAFTRFEMKTLVVNKWFKNIFSLIIAQEILTQIRPSELVSRYRPIQKQALIQMETDLSLKSNPSDVILLSYNSDPADKQWRDYLRRSNYRFCLTPYFLEIEKKNENS